MQHLQQACIVAIVGATFYFISCHRYSTQQKRTISLNEPMNDILIGSKFPNPRTVGYTRLHLTYTFQASETAYQLVISLYWLVVADDFSKSRLSRVRSPDFSGNEPFHSF